MSSDSSVSEIAIAKKSHLRKKAQRRNDELREIILLEKPEGRRSDHIRFPERKNSLLVSALRRFRCSECKDLAGSLEGFALSSIGSGFECPEETERSFKL